MGKTTKFISCGLCVLLPFLLDGCIVAAEKPNFNTEIVSGRAVNQPIAQPEAKQAGVPSTNIVILPPVTCANLPDDQDLAKNPDARELRNSCISNVKTKIHESYIEYRRQIARKVGLTEESLDVAGGAASAASTATTGTAAKVLSAITSTITGGKSAFDSDSLYKQSLGAIFKQMDADVDQASAEIDASTQQSYASYPMYRARFDLLQYYAAGTIQHALDSVDAATGTAKATCSAAQKQVTTAVNQGATIKPAPGAPGGQAQTDNTSTTAQCKQILQSASKALQDHYQYGPIAKTLNARLHSGKDDGPLDTAVYKKIQTCMTGLKYLGDPIQFINGGIAEEIPAQGGNSQGETSSQAEDTGATAEARKEKVLECLLSSK